MTKLAGFVTGLRGMDKEAATRQFRTNEQWHDAVEEIIGRNGMLSPLTGSYRYMLDPVTMKPVEPEKDDA